MVGSSRPRLSNLPRLRFLAGLFLLGFFVVVIRLTELQVVSGDYWKLAAESQHGGVFTLLPRRGEVQAQDKKNGQTITLATTAKKPLVYAVPQLVENTEEVAGKLSEILEIEDKNEIIQKLADKSKRYVVIKRNLSEDQANKIKSLGLNTVRLEDESVRFYPAGEILAATLGFVGYKDADARRQGLYGLERAFDQALMGEEGSLTQDRAGATRAWIFGGKRDFLPPKDGENLLLTIDVPVQRKAEEVMKLTLEKHGADRGCAIVLDPVSGAIIAMASSPGFDLNNYSQVANPAVYNNVCLSSYEPGSVFKPITMAAGLDDSKVTPETTYEDKGQVKIDGFTIKNSDGQAHGEQTMTEVLEKSLNTGAIFVKDSLGEELFKKWVKKFGFGQKTGVEVAESSGNLKNLDVGVNVNFATASFGQGISTTPLQMALSYGVFANGGRKVRPYIVQTRIGAGGNRMDIAMDAGDGILKSLTATKLTSMLVSVVENGHGKKAKVSGYSVAGKTGTAQVVLPGGKGYDEHKTIGTFVGYAPAFAPKFVVLVRVDNPSTVQFAESTAAPAFQEIMRFVLDRFNVPPDRLDNVSGK